MKLKKGLPVTEPLTLRKRGRMPYPASLFPEGPAVTTRNFPENNFKWGKLGNKKGVSIDLTETP